MPANTPTTTPALSPATHIVAGNTLNLQLGNVGLAMSWQIEDAGLGQTYTDGSIATFTSPSWYGFDEIPDGLFIVTNGNSHGNQNVGLRYSLLPKTDVDPSLGAGTEGVKLIVIDYNPPRIDEPSKAVTVGAWIPIQSVSGLIALSDPDTNDEGDHALRLVFGAHIQVKDNTGTPFLSGSYFTGGVIGSDWTISGDAAGTYSISVYAAQDNTGAALSTAATLTVTVSAASTSRPSTVSRIAALIATGIIK